MSRIFSLGGQRRIAIDFGGSAIKVLLAEITPGGLKVLRRHLLDLREEGLYSPEEVSRQLTEMTREMGSAPIALNLQQHLASTQLASLPSGTSEEVRRRIEGEAVRLSGLGETAVVHDYCPLKPFGKHANPCWVAAARESDVQQQISRLMAPDSAIAEVVPAANALIAAFAAFHPGQQDAVLVDLGAHSTVIVVIHQGQGVYASSFPVGSEAFTEAIETRRKCGFEEAETLKRTRNVFQGDDAAPGFTAVFEGWLRDVEKVVADWRQSQGDEPGGAQVPIYLSGGGARQPGLIDAARGISKSGIQTWGSFETDAGEEVPLDPFAVACGIALDALGRNPQHASLLPPAIRAARKQLQQRAAFGGACALILGILAAVLLAAFWQRAGLIREKQALLRQAEEAIGQGEAIQAAARRIERDYAHLRPVIEMHHHSLRLIEALNAFQQSRAQGNLWYVLFADQQSYVSGMTVPQWEPEPASPTSASMPPPRPLPRSLLVAELCIPDRGDTLRRLSDIVAELKTGNVFRTVDSLPAHQRRQLVAPELVIPDRHYALQIELAPPEFQEPSLLRRAEPRPPGGVRGRRTTAPPSPRIPQPPPDES